MIAGRPIVTRFHCVMFFLPFQLAGFYSPAAMELVAKVEGSGYRMYIV